MKRVVVASAIILISFAALVGATFKEPVGSAREKTLILRVRTKGSIKRASFSGQLQFASAASPTLLRGESTPFGIKVSADSVKGTLQKDIGSPDLSLELIEFIDEREAGCITKTGATFDIDAHQLDGKSVLTIH